MRYSWESTWVLHGSVQCRDDVLHYEILHCSLWWLTECRKPGLRKLSTSGLKVPTRTYRSVKSLKYKYKILKVSFSIFHYESYEKSRRMGNEIIYHGLKILFAVRSTIQGAEVAFLSFDQRRYGSILFQTCTSKIDFRSPRFHVLQFSHYCTPLVAPPFLCKSCPLFGH